ncbi:MAG: hypothetical protein ACMG6S_09520 [Byssovorax sp.]
MSWITTKLLGVRQLLFGGAPLAQRGAVNFVSGALVADNPATGATDITIDATTVFTDATYLATPSTIVKRSVAGSANFAGTCHFVGIDATGPLASGALTCNGNATILGTLAVTSSVSINSALEVGGGINCGDSIYSSSEIECVSDLRCGSVISGGPVQGSRFAIAAALAETRIQQGTCVSVGWTPGGGMTWSNATLGVPLYIPINIPNGAILDTVSVYIQGAAAHAGLPASPPVMSVKRYNISSTITLTVTSLIDTSANVAAFQALHAITKTSIAHTIDKTLNRYFVQLDAESGGSALVGATYLYCVITYTRPAGSYIGQD